MIKEVDKCSFCGRDKKKDKVKLITNERTGAAICFQCLDHITPIKNSAIDRESKVEPYSS